MFDRFTDKAKQAMNLARKAAQRFDHSYLGPEHMLHGVLSVEDSRASQILASRAIVSANVLATLERHIVPPASKPTAYGQLLFTPDAKRVLEKSMEAAYEAHHDLIGTEHFLLALSECGSDIIEEVLREHSLTPAMLRQGLMDPAAKPEDDPQAPHERTQARRTAKQQEQILEQALRVALELGDEPAARAIWGLIQKLKT